MERVGIPDTVAQLGYSESTYKGREEKEERKSNFV